MRRIKKIAGTVILAGAWAAIAGATPPSKTTFVIVDDFLIVECGDYNVRTNADSKITQTLWFDDDENPIRVQVKIKVTRSEYYNDVDPAISISQGANGVGENVTIDIDLVTGAQHDSGAAFRLTIPGIGHVLMSTETFKFDEDGNIVIHGHDFALAEGETGLALCEALAP